VKTWKTMAGFVVATAALSACGGVMISGLPLPGDTAWVPAEAPVAATSGVPAAPPRTGADEPDPAGDRAPADEGPGHGDGDRPARPGEPGEQREPAPGEPSPDVVVGSTEHQAGKHIALTFDDGPDPTWTPRVLDLLDQYDVQATFCVVGENAREHPDLVRRIAGAGHALCDHTMHHDEKLPARPAADRKAEIKDCRDAIIDAAPDADVRYFRAPAGAFSRPGDPDPDSVQRIAARLGMQPLAWSIDTEDWTKPGVAAIVDSVQQAGDHDVVLLHDAGGDRQQTMTALEKVLPWLVDQGYEFDLPA
jgi:peptidoglycan/xylan/chitin deacetylase (PgdA/CDA1 family)